MSLGTSVARADAQLWPLSGAGLWVAIPLVALAYCSVAAISLALAIPPGYASAIWPPAGIALAAWLAFGPRIWPGILLGAALANFGVGGTSAAVALAIGAGNAAEAVVAGIMVRRLITLRHRFERPAAVWTFAAIAFGAALVAATAGVATLAIAGKVPWSEFSTHWTTWWLGDATGIIIVAPLLLCWSEPASSRTAAERRIEYQLFGALVILFGGFAWAASVPSETLQTLAYLMIPLVTWAAARLDQRAVTAASFAISAVAVFDMLDGSASMFLPLSLNQSLLLLQLFVSAVALSGLTLSALAGEVVRANLRLESAQSELERAARERGAELERMTAQQRLLARRMVRVRDEERSRLAADLHDTVAQDLTSLNVGLDLARTPQGRSTERVAQLLEITRRASKALREIIVGLRPPALDHLAFSAALRQHAAGFEARTGILVTVSAEPGRDLLPVAVKDVLLRITLEALTNIAKHADASSVRIALESGARRTRLSIDDDGRGFDSAAVESASASTGAGLSIMRERALALGARFAVRSALGSGTRVEVTLHDKQDIG
jgi:signal transduction histidine kinase